MPLVMVILIGRRVLGRSLPPLSIVQFHPIILSILNFSQILQRLGEQITQVIVVGGIFEPQVAYVGKVLVEFIYELLVRCRFMRQTFK